MKLVQVQLWWSKYHCKKTLSGTGVRLLITVTYCIKKQLTRCVSKVWICLYNYAPTWPNICSFESSVFSFPEFRQNTITWIMLALWSSVNIYSHLSIIEEGRDVKISNTSLDDLLPDAILLLSQLHSFFRGAKPPRALLVHFGPWSLIS